jgi:hypothetical protein
MILIKEVSTTNTPVLEINATLVLTHKLAFQWRKSLQFVTDSIATMGFRTMDCHVDPS